jgi:hypothetical protein
LYVSNTAIKVILESFINTDIGNITYVT